jgi:hypothetical protein
VSEPIPHYRFSTKFGLVKARDAGHHRGMKPLLVVQNNLVVRLTAPLAEAARARGITIHDISSVDDMSGVPPYPAGLNKPGMVGPVLVYGSIGFVHEWAKKHPELQRWVFWSDEAAEAETWRRNLGDLYLNADGWETIVGEAVAYEKVPRHYRPMTTTKSIVGSVLTPEKLHEIARNKNIDSSFRIWSSAPKTIDMEVRVFMIAGQVAGHSVYRRDGEFCYDNTDPRAGDALNAAQMISDRYSPARHFVCDVGLVNGEWKLIEFNPLHSSGWYGTDVGGVLDAYMASES